MTHKHTHQYQEKLINKIPVEVFTVTEANLVLRWYVYSTGVLWDSKLLHSHTHIHTKRETIRKHAMHNEIVLLDFCWFAECELYT